MNKKNYFENLIEKTNGQQICLYKKRRTENNDRMLCSS